MTTSNKSALELFDRLRIRYREITWLAGGFSQKHADLLFLEPARNTSLIGMCSWYGINCPYFNFREGGIDFFCTLSHQGKDTVLGQLARQGLERLMMGPFAGRQFYMDPAAAGLHEIPVQFSVSGPPIPGLHLGAMVASHWEAFIPVDSPEGKAILAAERLERLQCAQAKKSAELAHCQEEIGRAERECDEALAAVSD